MSDEKKVDLKLNSAPDEYGFIYGHLMHNGETYNVDIMPPKRKWAGGQVLNGYIPHDHDWVIYLEGEEFVRVQKEDEIISRLQIKLLV